MEQINGKSKGVDDQSRYQRRNSSEHSTENPAMANRRESYEGTVSNGPGAKKSANRTRLNWLGKLYVRQNVKVLLQSARQTLQEDHQFQANGQTMGPSTYQQTVRRGMGHVDAPKRREQRREHHYRQTRQSSGKEANRRGVSQRRSVHPRPKRQRQTPPPGEGENLASTNTLPADVATTNPTCKRNPTSPHRRRPG